LSIRDDVDNTLKGGAVVLFFLPDAASEGEGRVGDVFVGFHLTMGRSGAMVVDLPLSRYFILDGGGAKELGLRAYPQSVYAETIRFVLFSFFFLADLKKIETPGDGSTR
jgi:hypothetical protein